MALDPAKTTTTTTTTTPATASLAAAATPPVVAAVSIKLPPFWPADPEVWFAQVEAQFTTRRITSQRTMFDHVVSSLNPTIATEVRDLLLRPPEANPYNTLRAQLIKRTAASEQRKLQQLISGEELGDRKPTQLLRRMQQLLGDHLDGTGGADLNAFLRELFLQRLPPNVRMVLASADNTIELHKLADMADKIMEVATPALSVSSVSEPPLPSPELLQLKAEFSGLASLVASLTTSSNNSRYRSRRRSVSRNSRHTSPAPLPNSNSAMDSSTHALCWYHRRYGDNANKCKQPCSWGNEQAGH